MNFSENQLDIAKTVSLPLLLQHFGVLPCDKSIDCARISYRYLASYRGERHPSLSVFLSNGHWLYKDFSTGEYGTNIDLLVRFGFFDCWQESTSFILSFNCPNSVELFSSPSERLTMDKHSYSPEAYGMISSKSSISGSPVAHYIIEERRIPLFIAEAYVNYVTYRYKGKERLYSGIGWPTSDGGYAIRWPVRKNGKSFVGPSGFSFFPVSSNCRRCCDVFEGIFDFLSYVASSDGEQINDAVVLNSVYNIERAMPALRHYHSINCFLDNDIRGREALKKIIDDYPSAVDCIGFYKEFNDVNDWWVKSGIIR